MTPTSSTAKVSSVGSKLYVSGHDFLFEFNTARGVIIRWTKAGVDLLQPDPRTGAAVLPSFWRPPTDNDVPGSLPYWQRFGVHELSYQLRSLSVDTLQSGKTVVKTRTFITPPVLDWGWDCTINYGICDDGSLLVDVARLRPTGRHPRHIPRAGLNLYLNKALDSASWFGLGPGESYPDKRAAARVGIWGPMSVPDLQTPYDVPQENGNRMDSRWLKLTGNTGAGIQATPMAAGGAGSRPLASFSWAASHHSPETIESAKHPPDLFEEDATILRLDAKVAGVGTAACGPGVREHQLVTVEEMSFGFKIESTRR